MALRNQPPFNDLFHGFNDDDDEGADDYVDFNDPYRTMDKEDDISVVIEIRGEEEVERQLLTTTEPSQSSSSSSSSAYKKFERMLRPIVDKVAYVFDMKHLYQMVILQHQLAFIELNIRLWTVYLCSGTGRLLNEQQQATVMIHTMPNIWPEDVKIMMIEKRITPATNINEISDDSCLTYVQQSLHEFQKQITHYQTAFDMRQTDIDAAYWTSEIKQAMENFVEQQGIKSHRLRIEGKLLLVKYEYKDRCLELAFQNQKPNEYQMGKFQNLIQTKFDKEKAISEVALLKQRLLYKCLPETIANIQLPVPTSLASIQNEKTRQRLMNQHEKIVERTKADMIHVYVIVAEAKMNEYTMKYDDIVAQTETDRHAALDDKQFNETMSKIIEQRHQNIDERFRYLCELKLHFFGASSNDQELDLVHRRSIDIPANKSTKNSCAPTLFQDAIHYLSIKELAFLHRGPTYVSPCQLHDVSSSVLFDLTLETHIAPLQEQLKELFTKYNAGVGCCSNFQKAVEKQFFRSFSEPIPTAVKERAFNEKKLIQSIQLQLKQNNLILRRTADDQNMYYLGERDEFYRMANEFIDNMLCYECITVIDNQNKNFEQEYLHELIHSINSDLKKLQQNRIMREDDLLKMQIDKKDKIKVPHLYFLPETHKDGHITVQPRFTCLSSGQYPIQRLATYLDQLLRPLVVKYLESTNFRNGTDFIQQLENYCGQSNRLRPATNFITFEIHHFYYRISHEALGIALNKFLHCPAVEVPRYGHLTADAIEQLVKYVLDHLIFTYNGKIYRHIKGSPLNIPLIELLYNIYLYYWQLPLLSEVRLANQFYGRYYQMGFLTWHGSRDKLNRCFDKLNRQYPDIPVTISIGLHVNFLNVDIENRQGYLHTCVYHDPNQQPFLLPYVIGHPRLLHRKWVRFALLRAGQYCSSWDDFQDERIYIELTCLANGYSLDFVEYHIQQFFTRFNLQERGLRLTRWTYPSLRPKFFLYINEQQQLKSNQSFIELSYLFDWGSRCEFNVKFNLLWQQTFALNTRLRNLYSRIKLISKHCYPSNTFFFP